MDGSKLIIQPGVLTRTECIPRYSRLRQMIEHHPMAHRTPRLKEYCNKQNTNSETWSRSVIMWTIYVQFRLTWYLFIVYRITDRGIETPTIACVDGIPYSKAHFFCRRTTGGQEGRGHRTTSLIPWPMAPKLNIVITVQINNQNLLTTYENLCEFYMVIFKSSKTEMNTVTKG